MYKIWLEESDVYPEGSFWYNDEDWDEHFTQAQFQTDSLEVAELELAKAQKMFPSLDYSIVEVFPEGNNVGVVRPEDEIIDPAL